LITGLSEAEGEYAAVCACDMPFINSSLIERLFNASDGSNGTLLLKPNGWIEPMPSVYHVSNCLSYAKLLRKLGEMRIRKVLETLPGTTTLHVEKLRSIDPDLLSFIDLDTAASVKAAHRLLQARNICTSRNG
jgi:molybdopterin-guanine dinucleotide biosynthesis protein A